MQLEVVTVYCTIILLLPLSYFIIIILKCLVATITDLIACNDGLSPLAPG